MNRHMGTKGLMIIADSVFHAGALQLLASSSPSWIALMKSVLTAFRAGVITLISSTLIMELSPTKCKTFMLSVLNLHDLPDGKCICEEKSGWKWC